MCLSRNSLMPPECLGNILRQKSYYRTLAKESPLQNIGNQSHPVYAILGLAMIHHLKFTSKKLQSMFHLFISSSLELRKSCLSLPD